MFYKVTSNPFCFQQVFLEAFSHADAGSGNMGVFPVRTLEPQQSGVDLTSCLCALVVRAKAPLLPSSDCRIG